MKEKLHTVNRRSFVKLAAAVGAATALGGCASPRGEASEPTPAEEQPTAPLPEDAASESTVPEPAYAESPFPRHEPYGHGIGVAPGRVAWVRDEAVVSWDGSGYWWQHEHFDDEAVKRMMDDAIVSVGGDAASLADAWQALFQEHNARRGVAGGYRPGQKIAVKCNMNGAGTNGQDADSSQSYTTPTVLRALLLSLVEDAGVAPEDITAFDACRIFPRHMMALCSEGALAGVRFSHYNPGGSDDALPDERAPVVWSQDVPGTQNCLPACVTEAEYLINLASLKGHEYGITLCGKNHFGTIMNSNRLRPPEAAGIHRYLTNRTMDAYTVLVDLMANESIGGKTVLNLLDGLIVAPNNSVGLTREDALWESEPFSGGFTASILASQDPVALDSVGADFLMNEPAVVAKNAVLASNVACENYLHEAGRVAAAPSGTVYLNGNGSPVENLGVHEHWDNPINRRYSRNLGASEGIELVQILR